MERVICIAVGYAFGLFQTGYIYGKMHNIDIRTQGSGNAGTTNALRTMGWKAGFTTFLGDLLKCALAVLCVRLIYGAKMPEMLPVFSMYAGMGAVLGHNFPFYLKFKGGKGIAATAGLILSTTNLKITLICYIAFLLTVAITKYVSVGSMVILTSYLICVIVYGTMGGYQVTGTNLWEIYGIAIFLVVLGIYRHKANIQRLLSGTENKLSVGKTKK